MNTTLPNFLKWLARALWYLFAGGVVLLFLLGIRPALAALISPTPDLTELWTVTTAEYLTTETSLNSFFVAVLMVGLRGILLVVWISLGYLILRQARFQTFHWFLWFVAFFMVFFGALPAQDIIILGVTAVAPDAVEVTSEVINTLGYLSLATFIYMFPDGRFVPRWAGLGLLGWFVLWFLQNVLPFVFAALFLLLGVVCLIYRYRRVASPHQQRQIKWIVWGLTVFIITSLILIFINPILSEVGFLLSIFLPISIGIAMLRNQLWDVDIVIRKTLVYGILTVLLGLVYFGIVTLLQTMLASVTGEQSTLAIVISTLAIAALFSPLRRRIQEVIDRRFYRRKYDAEKALAAFSLTVREEVDLDSLSKDLLSVVKETMEPETISLWLKSD